jgi:hypothetical protein
MELTNTVPYTFKSIKRRVVQMKKMQVLMLAAAMFSLNGLLFAGEMIDIKGNFGSDLKFGMPEGWGANKPGYWEETSKVALNKIADTDKYALQITAQTKTVHLYGKILPAVTGDKCIVKGKVRGKGKGELGVYFRPPMAVLSKKFEATDEWTEIVAEVVIPKNTPDVQFIHPLMVARPESSIEFSDVTLEIVRKE